MKEKDILKIIKDDIESNTPNILDKIDLKQIRIKPTPLKVTKKRTFNLFSMLSVATAALVIGLFAGILLYKPNNTQHPIMPVNVSVTNKDKTVAEYALAGVSLASNSKLSTSANSRTTNLMMMLGSEDEATLSDVETFHSYVGILEEYLKLVTNEIEIIKDHTDRYNYQYKMTITKTSVFGIKESYILYYDEKREVDEDEEEKEMQGILLFNDRIYNFKSEEETETDESEIKVIIYKENNYDNRIVIEKEIEVDEYNHKYTIYSNDKVKLEVTLSAEEDETLLTIENDEEKVYYISKKGNYEFIIHLGDDDEDPSFSLLIDINNLNYKYILNEEEIIK